MLTAFIRKMMAAKGRRVFDKFEEVTREPLKHNLNTLFQILEENKDTEYGQKHGFAQIHTLEDFKSRVPFSSYDTYAPYIEEMKKGKGNLITKERPVYFAATSGSVANPKAIPVCERTRQIYKDYSAAFGFAVIDRYYKGKRGKGKFLNLVEIKMTPTPCGTPYGSVSGMGANSIRRLMPYIITTPLECVFPNEKFDNNYIHLRFALVYRDLDGIVSAFMTAVTDIFRYLEENWELLLEDIERGTINKEIQMSGQMRAALLKRIKPEPERAAELRKELEKGFEGDVFKRIWPKLSFIYAIGSGGFSSYTKIARRFAGDTPIYFSFYAASESLMAVCTQMESARYTLLPEAAFFEFIPLEQSESDNPESLTIDQLKQGEKYELALTNPSGFYRYRIQDVVEVVGMHNGTPEIEFAYRLNQMVSMAGEKTNDGHFRWAVSGCAEDFGFSIAEYSVFPKDESLPGRYVVVLEGDNQKIKPNAAALRNALEKKLSEANPSLGAKIEAGILGPVEIALVQEETYALYRDLMVMRGISPNQIKPIRIIDTPEKERFFFGLLDKEE